MESEMKSVSSESLFDAQMMCHVLTDIVLPKIDVDMVEAENINLITDFEMLRVTAEQLARMVEAL